MRYPIRVFFDSGVDPITEDDKIFIAESFVRIAREYYGI